MAKRKRTGGPNGTNVHPMVGVGAGHAELCNLLDDEECRLRNLLVEHNRHTGRLRNELEDALGNIGRLLVRLRGRC